jgi:hypothetical protein
VRRWLISLAALHRKRGSQVSGLDKCVAAFGRLKEEQPLVDAHRGLSPTKITAGVVSVEAGFDRGYLKKSRGIHRPLLDEISAYRDIHVGTGTSGAEELRRANDRAATADSKLVTAEQRLNRVLTQNLQLVERVKELETNLQKYQTVLDFSRS